MESNGFATDELVDALGRYQSEFSLKLPNEVVEHLARFYATVMLKNPLLHLVAPCSPQEFATRHILESLTLLDHLPRGSRFADVGAGAGLPSIPCLIARADLSADLLESKEKKANFLTRALAELGLRERAAVMNNQFAETAPSDDTCFVTCRALDKFSQHLRRLVTWSGARTMLFFGGEALPEELARLRLSFQKQLMPLSERRYLYVIEGSGDARR